MYNRILRFASYSIREDKKIFIDNGYRSKCCYAPLKLVHKKLKNTTVKLKEYQCLSCKRRGVDIVKYSTDGPPKSTSWLVDPEDDDLVELDAEEPYET